MLLKPTVSSCNANASDGFMRIVWTIRTSVLMEASVLYVDLITTCLGYFDSFLSILAVKKQRVW